MLSPLASGGVRLVSRDGHSALVVVSLGDVRASTVREAILAAQPAHPAITIEETGDITATDAVDHASSDNLQRAEILSVPVTLIILIFAFGALVAASVPVLLALTAVVAAYALQGPVSQLFQIDDSVRIVLVLIGMAVGVDYALFYVIRSREERRRGLPSHEALEVTARTSGRTVIVSGTTVIVAMAGLFLVHTATFRQPGGRDDHGGRLRRRGVGHCASRCPRAARAADRPGPDPVPAPPADRPHALAVLDRRRLDRCSAGPPSRARSPRAPGRPEPSPRSGCEPRSRPTTRSRPRTSRR